MTEEHSLSDPQVGNQHPLATKAAAPLRDHGADTADPDLHHIALARRLSTTATVGGLALVVGAVLTVSLVASAALPWVVGAVLALAVAGIIVLGAHAGGHGFFVPLPVVALAAVWAIVVSTGNWSSSLAWVLAALVFGSAMVAGLLIVPAIAYRKAAGPAVGNIPLAGANGIAIGALSPGGIVKVNNETWTAESLSGPLPAGAPVHVARVEGLRLLVWSETGTVLGPEDLDFSNQQKEEA
jgi:membrane-bound ClpP family serine protease